MWNIYDVSLECQLFHLTVLSIANVLYSTGNTQIDDWWNDIDKE